MTIDRRTVLSGLATALAAPRIARAAGEGDRIGRMFAPPAKVERVFAAGPPAAIRSTPSRPSFCWAGHAGRRRRNARSLARGLRPRSDASPAAATPPISKPLLGLKPDLILDVGT